MKELNLKKNHFIDAEPSEKVWLTISSRMRPVVRGSLLARFHYRYVAVPVFLMFIFGSYIVFFAQSPLEKEITQTQTAMNELITLVDTETF